MQPCGKRHRAEICQRESGETVARENGSFVQVESSAGAAQNDHHGMRPAARRNEQSPDGCFASGGASGRAWVCTLGFVWDFQIARHSFPHEKISREAGAREHLAVSLRFEIHWIWRCGVLRETRTAVRARGG